jgi:hypothetical protein
MSYSFVELSYSPEATSCAATQKLFNILWGPKVYYCVHNNNNNNNNNVTWCPKAGIVK